MDKKAFLEEWFRRVWAEEDAEAISELMAEDASMQGHQEIPLRGADEFRQFHKLMLSQLAEIRIEVVQSIEQGDWIAATVSASAAGRERGAKVSARSQVMFRIVDGRVVEGQILFDFIALFEQLGRLPPRTLDRCLLGDVSRFFPSAADRHLS